MDLQWDLNIHGDACPIDMLLPALTTILMDDAPNNNPLEHELPDDLILTILSYSEATDLVAFQQTCRRFKNLSASNDLWREVCHRRWQAWPIYSDLSQNEEVAGSRASRIDEQWNNWTWKERYQWVEGDFRRTEITIDELEGLEWYFNYLPWAGGSSNGIGTRSDAYFHRGRLYLLKYLWMYPFLNCRLLTTDDGDETVNQDEWDEHDEFRQGLESSQEEALRQAVISAGASSPRCSSKQYLQISTFPPHYIARTSIGGWILWNFHVVFFSAGVPRGEELPDQLQIHMDMFRFAGV